MHETTPTCSSLPASIPPDQEWTVESVTPETTNEAVTFINNARHDMFPTLHTQLADDVARWVQSGCFLLSRETTTREIIATIGYVPYDHRFSDLHFHDMHTVEVVRLYVLPVYRRAGLGARLFEDLKKRAEEQGVERLYLHTHPFLPGAVRFWKKRGFGVVGVERDEVWRTTHMEMLLKS